MKGIQTLNFKGSALRQYQRLQVEMMFSPTYMRDNEAWPAGIYQEDQPAGKIRTM
jgi:hypothetical protein